MAVMEHVFGSYTLTYDRENRGVTVFHEGRVATTLDEGFVDYPLRVLIDLSDLCNMACTYCSVDLNAGKKLEHSAVRGLIDNVADAFEICFRGGEPTTYPGFFDLYSYAAQRSTANVITNGLVLNMGKVSSMLEVNGRILISLDGTKETNDTHRGPRQYDVVMSWLPEALRRYPSKIGVITTVYKRNVDRIVELGEVLADLGLRKHYLNPLKKIGAAEEAELVAPERIMAVFEQLQSLRPNHPLYDPVWVSSKNHPLLEKVPLPSFIEMFPSTSLRVLPDGYFGITSMVHFSQGLQDNTSVPLDRLGHINQGNVLRIWREKTANRVAQAAFHRRIAPALRGERQLDVILAE